MSKQLKPVIRYNRSKTDGLFDSQYASHNVAYLCHPLTPASRKAMIEAMAKAINTAMFTDSVNPAEAALSALEKMANETP